MGHRLADLFGTRLPIIQAPMAGVQGHALAAAACRAGALGSLPAAMLTAESLAQELRALRAGTDAPFNLNFFCHAPPQVDTTREATWREQLLPYYREFAIDPASIPSGPGRTPFSADLARIAAPYAPPVVSFHFGLPSADLLATVRGWGAKVIASATSVDEARWLEARGADAVIAQGVEAGGHRGHFLTADLDVATQAGTFALLPQVVASVRCPVIAAGGIVDAAGVAAAFALGAAGVQVGTAFLCCDEATTSRIHRDALMSDAARVTALTNVYTGRPARGIVNRVMRELGLIRGDAPAFPLATASIAPLRAAAEARGSGDFSPLWAGQNASRCRAVSAATVIDELASGLPR